MNTTPVSTARIVRGGFLRFVIDHNPFYLLSAACMLGGLLTLTNSLSYSPIPQRNLLMLISTLNCYELLLVALAVWLIVNRKLIRDGSILLGIEALFLADTAMLNAELFTVDRLVGTVVNALLLLLAAAKLAIIFRALRVRSINAYGLILASLALLLSLPGFFKDISSHHNGRLPALAIYAGWWAVGLLPVIFAFVFRRPDPAAVDRRPRAHGRLVLVFVCFAFLSILLHLRLSNWVYLVRWEWANLAPPLLGLAVCIGTLDHHVQTLALRLRAQLALPILAVALSMSFSSAMFFHPGSFPLSPMRLALAGAGVVYLHGYWLHRHVYFALAGAIGVLSIGLGASPEAAVQNFKLAWDWVTNVFERHEPRSTSDWGLLAVIASFVLLVLGAGVSLLKGESPGANAQDVPPARA